MNYFTVEEDLKQLHIQIPKALLYEKKYNRLSNDAKILYGFLTAASGKLLFDLN